MKQFQLLPLRGWWTRVDAYLSRAAATEGGSRQSRRSNCEPLSTHSRYLTIKCATARRWQLRQLDRALGVGIHHPNSRLGMGSWLRRSCRLQMDRVSRFRRQCRKIDTRLPGKRKSNSMAQGQSTKIISMMQWIRTSRLPIKDSLSPGDASGDDHSRGARLQLQVSLQGNIAHKKPPPPRTTIGP